MVEQDLIALENVQELKSNTSEAEKSGSDLISRWKQERYLSLVPKYSLTIGTSLAIIEFATQVVISRAISTFSP